MESGKGSLRISVMTFINDEMNRFRLVVVRSIGAGYNMYSSLNDTGRAAIVLDTGAASRGSGKTR